MNICGIARYTFVDIIPLEEKMVEIAMGASLSATSTRN
jgi:hypothetical protein